MRLIRLWLGRLCFRLSLRIAMAGTVISGLKLAPEISFPLYHY